MRESLVGEGKNAGSKEREPLSAEDGRGWRVCGIGERLLCDCGISQRQLELKG